MESLTHIINAKEELKSALYQAEMNYLLEEDNIKRIKLTLEILEGNKDELL
jgi:hypothetical protein